MIVEKLGGRPDQVEALALTSRTVERAPGRPRASGVQRFGALPVSVPGATIGCCAGVLTRGAEVLPDMPDNRELATATLLIGFVICGLTVRRARERIPDVVRSAAPLAGLLTLYLATASLTVWAAWSVGLWTADLWWATVIVVLGLGMGLVSKAIDARSARALWNSIGGTTIGSAVFIGLYANLVTFPLFVELVLRVLATLAAILRVVADHQDQKPVRRLADGVLVTIGLVLQLHLCGVFSSAVVGLSGAVLVSSSPDGSVQGAVGFGNAGPDQSGDQVPDFGEGERDQPVIASGVGGSFAPFFDWVTVRKAWASIDRVMCRYQPVHCLTW